MRIRLFLLAGLVVVMAFTAVSATAADNMRRRIAITIDDAPRADTTYLSGNERATRLIEALQRARVPKVMFFTNTGRPVPNDTQRMRRYAAAGHAVGNHSHTHPDLHRVGVDAFVADIKAADELLRTRAGHAKWFRFPYLREGRTVEERNAVRVALKDIGYRSAYVTVDTYDWYMDTMFQNALKAGKTVDFERLGEAYVDLMTDSIEFYDGVAQQTLGRSPRHVLLMHENDLAALYIDDLVGRLRTNGWEIVSAEDAYADPIATMEPRTLTLGQGRVIALAVDNGYQGSTRKWEDEQQLEAEFAGREVWR